MQVDKPVCPVVTDRSGERSQTFNSTDFDGMKYTQLSPLKYKLKNDILHKKCLCEMIQVPNR